MPKVTPLEEPITFDNICPIVYALNIIGQKWKIPILWHLADEGTLRYNELTHGENSRLRLIAVNKKAEVLTNVLRCTPDRRTIPLMHPL